MTQPAHITIFGKKNELESQVAILAEDHFKRVPSFFVVIGMIRGRKDLVFENVLSSFEIPYPYEKRIHHFNSVNESNIGEITMLATNPNCIGVLVFGSKEKSQKLLHKYLEEGNVWGDYVYISQDTSVTTSRLKEGVSKFLRFFFEEELKALVR